MEWLTWPDYQWGLAEEAPRGETPAPSSQEVKVLRAMVVELMAQYDDVEERVEVMEGIVRRLLWACALLWVVVVVVVNWRAIVWVLDMAERAGFLHFP